MHGAIPDGLAREYLCRRDGIDKDSRSAAPAFNRSLKLVFAYVHGRMFQVVRFYIIAAALQRRRLLVAAGPDRLGFFDALFPHRTSSFLRCSPAAGSFCSNAIKSGSRLRPPPPPPVCPCLFGIGSAGGGAPVTSFTNLPMPASMKPADCADLEKICRARSFCLGGTPRVSICLSMASAGGRTCRFPLSAACSYCAVTSTSTDIPR